MPKFWLSCEWRVSHCFTVEADTLDAAKEMVLNATPPYDKLPKGDYIDDSFKVDDGDLDTEG